MGLLSAKGLSSFARLAGEDTCPYAVRGGSCTSEGARAYIYLVEAFYQVEVGKGTVESINEGFAVWGDQDGADRGDAGGVSRH